MWQGASEPSRELPQGSLNPRRMRRIIAEDATWNEDRIKPLVQLCLDAVVANFKHQPVQNLPKEYQKKVLDALPATLPLEMAVKLIDDEGYWERAAKVLFRKGYPLRVICLCIHRYIFLLFEVAPGACFCASLLVPPRAAAISPFLFFFF